MGWRKMDEKWLYDEIAAIVHDGNPSLRPGAGEACAILYRNGDLVLQRGGEPDGSPGHAAGDVLVGPLAVPEEGAFSGPGEVPWRFRGDVRSVRVRDAISPASTAHWFCGLSSLAEVDLSLLDTSRVGDMRSMFSGCSSLASLDLSGWDTSRVRRMGFMFDGCSSLASLDLSGWDVSGVGNMWGMFDGCSSLASLDLSGWDVSRVGTMACMFCHCSSLASLDVSGWDVSGVGDMGFMFYHCSSLATLRIGPSFRLSSDMGLPEGVCVVRRDGR